MTPIVIFIGFIAVVALWSIVRRGATAAFATAGVLGGVLVIALTAWLLAPGLLVPTPTVQSGQAVGWELGHGFGGPKFDPVVAQTTTLIPMVVDHPGCLNDRDWLGEPAIAYTPWSVTITMQSRVPFRTTCGGSWYLSGMYTQVQLSEPLAGRTLFDGSKSPPHPRRATDTESSFSR
jgi:hypothetical protein